jgi:hypothetical protein
MPLVRILVAAYMEHRLFRKALHKSRTHCSCLFIKSLPAIVAIFFLLFGGCDASHRGHVRPRVIQADGYEGHAVFNGYDNSMIKIVQHRWYSLVDNNAKANQKGSVVLEFNLTSDGRITNMRVTKSEVPDLEIFLAKRAVLDSAPFPPWPTDMRRIIGKDYREVTFRFYYE